MKTKLTRLYLTVLILLLSLTSLAQTVSTSQGIFKLIPADKLVDATAARSAKQVAELAIPALISDSKTIAREREALQPAIDQYLSDLSKYNTDLDLYNISLGSYNKKLADYESELDRYNAALRPHDARVNTYNSKAQENRTQAEYDELMASKNRLDQWLARLNQDKSRLDTHLNQLDNHKQDLDYKFNTLNNTYDYLESKLSAVNIKMGKAYEQLEMLIKYANECNKILENWREPVLNTYNLNTELEKLKALSNKGWN